MTKVATPKNLTETEIETLATEAAEHDDIVLVVLCRRALGHRVDWQDYTGGGHSRQEIAAIRTAARVSTGAALERCAAAINNARAQED